MIIVRLMGGLGNQLFQYAFGRSFARRRKEHLFLDKSYFAEKHDKNVTPRKYALANFDIQAMILPNTVARLIASDRASRLPKFLGRLASRPFSIRHETSMDFDTNIYNAPRNVIFEGYWQSEKYFCDIKPLLRSELVSRVALSPECRAVAQTLRSSNVASIHVRRGDYVANPSAAAFHGTCSIDWYKAAISTLQAATPVDQFVIFSDDHDWAKENFHFLPNKIFSDKFETSGDWEDLHLMSCCRNNIIANSSFSWWAAWLNRHDQKIVVAPKKWFAQEYPLNDRIPHSWTVV